MTTSATCAIAGSLAPTGVALVSGTGLAAGVVDVVVAVDDGAVFLDSDINTDTGRDVGRGGGVLPVFGRGGMTAAD